MRARLGAAGLVLAVLLVMALRLAGQARGDSLTYDERAYVFSGRCLLATGRDLDPRQPAGFRLLAGAGTVLTPGVVAPNCGSPAGGQGWFAAQGPALRDLIAGARLPEVAVSLLLALVVAAWAWAAYGPAGAVAGAAVTAFEPTVAAHGHLATPDALLTLGVVGCLAAHWAWEQSGRPGWLAASSAGLALAMLAKVIALEVLPVLVLASFMPAAVARLRGRRGEGERELAPALLHAVVVAAAVAAGAWLLLCAAYLPLLSAGSSPVSWVAPPQWIHSLAYQMAQAAVGTTNYLNGTVYRGANPFYFPEALALKTSLPLLLLVVMALAVARRRVPPAASHLLGAATVIIAVPSLGGIDIGVRYVLALYPLMAMAAASLAWRAGWTRLPLLAAAFLGLLMVESVVRGGDSIGYFNQLAGSRPELYLADSNLDWGQDAWRLRDWWVGQGRPDLTTAYFGGLPLGDYGINSTELPAGAPPGDGDVAVSLTRLVVYGSPGDGLGTLRRCPNPHERVGVSIQLGERLKHSACAVR